MSLVTERTVGGLLSWETFAFSGTIRNRYMCQTIIPCPSAVCNVVLRDAHLLDPPG